MSVRPVAFIATTVVAVTVTIACGAASAPAACAKSSGASKSPGVGKVASPAPKAPAKPDPPAYKPPPPGAKPAPEVKPPPPRSKQQQDRAKAAASKPKAKPDPQDVDDAKATAPKRVTRGGSYTSSVTNNTYVYHDMGFYRRPGFIIDIWDPYDPFNYWSRPWSPYYGHPYMVAADCGGKDEHVEQPINVTVNVDDQGKVIGETAAPAGTIPPGTEPAATKAG